MGKVFIFSKIYSWLQSTELFERPSKKIPGNWQLFEYYFEPEKDLIHVKEEQLKTDNQFGILEFEEENIFSFSCNLPISNLASISKGTWSISKNFITFIHPDDFRKNLEFQFAFEKENLKLLKKDQFGKILFFGFFKRVK